MNTDKIVGLVGLMIAVLMAVGVTIPYGSLLLLA